MLLLNRRDSVEAGLATRTEKLGWKGWKTGMMKRKMMDMLSGNTKNWLLKTFFRKSWGGNRILPKVAPKSFSRQWKDEHN